MEHLDWAHEIAAGVARTLPSWFVLEDLLGPAGIGLIRAAARYDRSVPFRAYARRVVYGACIDSIRRREYKERGHRSLDAAFAPGCPRVDPERVDLKIADTLRDLGPSPEDVVSSNEVSAQMAVVWDRVRDLPTRHRAIIRGVYRDGLALVEIARKVEIGPSRASQIHREALQMLRAVCEDLKKAA